MIPARDTKADLRAAKDDRAALAARLNQVFADETVRVSARRLGVTPTRIQTWTKGVSGMPPRAPVFHLLARICRTYELSPTWLLLGEGPMRRGRAPSKQARETA